jgi:divalent metal cation (Fe/Co/Zn/Cd) transporter
VRAAGKPSLRGQPVIVVQTLTDSVRRKWVEISFFLLAPYVAVEAIETLIEGAAAETSSIGIALAAGTLVLCPCLGIAKQQDWRKARIARHLREGTQNVLCAILAGAVLVGLAANTLFGLWWIDPAIALAISALCLREGQKA